MGTEIEVVSREHWDTILNYVACTPDEALWGAVLQQGVVCALRPGRAGSLEDWEWIFESQLDERHVGSFRFCCEAVGIEPVSFQVAIMGLYMRGKSPRNLSGGTGFLSVQI